MTRWALGYRIRHKIDDSKGLVHDFLGRACRVPVTVLESERGRIAARSLELAWAAEKMRYFYDRLITNLKNGVRATANTTKWKPESWPTGELRGVGFTEAPRGALGHWVKIRDRKIESYQCVVPTTWNGAPRSPTGQLSAW